MERRAAECFEFSGISTSRLGSSNSRSAQTSAASIVSSWLKESAHHSTAEQGSSADQADQKAHRRSPSEAAFEASASELKLKRIAPPPSLSPLLAIPQADPSEVIPVNPSEPTSIIARALLCDERNECAFGDQSGQNFFQVKVHHRSAFASLRSRSGILPDSYLTSLSRCAKFHATGGKSKSKFFRTLDDVYVVKSVNQEEIDMFAASADKYFAYLENVHVRSEPSILVTIVGIYTVVTSTDGARPTKIHLIILDNLFRGVDTARVYDLKGNERNRYVKNPRAIRCCRRTFGK